MGFFGPSEPEKVQVYGTDLSCEICENDTFWKKESQLNTALSTFFGFDWADASATCIVCGRFGYIHWFLPM